MSEADVQHYRAWLEQKTRADRFAATINRIALICSAGLEVGDGPNMLYTDPEATLDAVWDALNDVGDEQ